MNLFLAKRAIKILKTEGWASVFKKTYIYFLSKIVFHVASKLHSVNSREYWNFRMKYDWNAVGGGVQTSLFAASLFANIDFKKIDQIKSVLDYGCATGDSAPIFKIFLPDTKIYLYDLSEEGLNKAINKYHRFLGVEKWNPRGKVNFVYCSNVIEHVENPKSLVNSLIEASDKYVCIQCPWEEKNLNGNWITPKESLGEHIWSINDSFFDKYIKDPRLIWTKKTAIVPMAWEGGIQVYYLGKLKDCKAN